MPGSLHYDGLAFDHRKGGGEIPEIKEVLGEGFDVILEDNHIHCEYDPKGEEK